MIQARAPFVALLLSGLLGGAALAANLPVTERNRELAGSFFNKAESCWDKRDLACALENVRKALVTDPDMLLAHVLLGRVLLAGGNAAGAEAAVERSFKLGIDPGELAPTLAEAQLLQGKHRALLTDARLDPARYAAGVQRHLSLIRARAHLEMGASDAGLALLEPLRKAEPESPELALAELPLRLQLGQLPQAMALAELALKREPQSAEARFARALVLQARQDPKAAEAFDQVLAVDPDHLEARLVRLQMHAAQGEWDAVRASLKLVPTAKAADPRVLYFHAQDAAQRGDSKALTTHLRKIAEQIDAQPEALLRYRPQMLLLTGLAHFGLGELDAAKRAFEIYRDSRGGSGEATQLLAQLYLNQKQTDAGIAALEAHLRARPTDAKALGLLGQAKLSAGQPQQAATLMREALAGQDRPEFQAVLAQSLLRMGQSADALKALQAAVRKEPARIEFGLQLAEALLDTGDAKGAQAPLADLARRFPTDARVPMLQGRQRLLLRDLTGAQQAFEAALKLQPGLTAAKIMLARVEVDQGRSDAAVARLTAMLKADESAVDACLELAAIDDARGRLKEALGWLDRAMAKATPRDQRPFAAKVELLMRRGQPVEARAAAKELLARAPDDFDALVLAARAALASGDTAAARPWLMAAAKQLGPDTTSQWLVARLLVNARDYQAASDLLDKALQSQPGSIALQSLKVETDLRLGRLDAAEQRARQVAKDRPNDPQAQSLLGQVGVVKGDATLALDALRKAHATAPTSETLLRLYAAQLNPTRDPGPQLAMLEQWLAKRPDDAVVRNALAESLVMFQRLPQARDHYERLLKQTGSNAVRNNLAEVLLRLKDPRALALANEAVAREPNNPNVLDTAGWAHAEAGQLDRALALLRDARLRQPGAANIRYHLAAVLARKGKRDEALAELRAALASPEGLADRAAAEALLGTLQTR